MELGLAVWLLDTSFRKFSPRHTDTIMRATMIEASQGETNYT